MAKSHVTIIGGGVAGLAAALRLGRSGQFAPLVLEREEKPGGLARSLHFKGISTDLGPHRLHGGAERGGRLDHGPGPRRPGEECVAEVEQHCSEARHDGRGGPARRRSTAGILARPPSQCEARLVAAAERIEVFRSVTVPVAKLQRGKDLIRDLDTAIAASRP